jgi:hypothetical protein
MDDTVRLPKDAPDPQTLRAAADSGFPETQELPPGASLSPPRPPVVRDLPDSPSIPQEGLYPPPPIPDSIDPDQFVSIPRDWPELKNAKQDDGTIVVNEEEYDTGSLLTGVLEKRRWRSSSQETKDALQVAGHENGDRVEPEPGTKYEIEERVVRAMALVGGTMPEIAAYFGCHENTISKRFGHIILEARASRKLRLRQAQWIKATEDRDTAMLIWLGKQELKQFDESRIRVGDLSRFSDDELAQLAQGKVPGNLIGPGKSEGDTEDK